MACADVVRPLRLQHLVKPVHRVFLVKGLLLTEIFAPGTAMHVRRLEGKRNSDVLF